MKKRKVIQLLPVKQWTYVSEGGEHPITDLPPRAQQAMKIMVDLDKYAQEIRLSPTAFGEEKAHAIDLLEASIFVLNEDVKAQLPKE